MAWDDFSPFKRLSQWPASLEMAQIGGSVNSSLLAVSISPTLSSHFLVCLFFLFHYEVIKLHRQDVRGGNAFSLDLCLTLLELCKAFQTMGISRHGGVLGLPCQKKKKMKVKKEKERPGKNKLEAVLYLFESWPKKS